MGSVSICVSGAGLADSLDVSEQYIFVHFFERPEDLTICPSLLEDLDEICEQMDET